MDQYTVPPTLPKHFRTWLVRACAVWLGATFVLALSAILWGLLALLGDASGAAVARSILMLAAAAWILLLGAHVLLLTWERIANHREGEALREGEAPAEPLVRQESD